MRAIWRTTARRRWRPAHWYLAAAAVGWLAFYAIRLPLGVDHGDEAYYATYQYLWVRAWPPPRIDYGIYQTFAILVFPLFRLFAWLQPSLAGGVLCLRLLFAGSCLVSAWCVWRFSRGLVGAGRAALIASVPVAFIPFGLPAVSYNTLAVFGSVSGTLLVSAAWLDSGSTGQSRFKWLVPAALSWVIAAIAYPPMVLGVAGTLTVGALYLRWFPSPLFRSFVLCLLAFGLAAGAALWLLFGSHLFDMVGFMRAYGGYLDLGRKLELARVQFGAQPFFVGQLVLASLSGVVLRRWPGPVATLTALNLSLTLVRTPALLLPAHDAMLLLACTLIPVPLWLGLRASADADQVIGFGVAAGLLSGLLCTWTSSNGLVNFAVGGALANLAGLVAVNRFAVGQACWASRSALTVLTAVVVGVLAIQSYQTVYGEGLDGGGRLTATITTGAYAGLRTTPEKAQELAELTRALTEQTAGFQSVGRLGGLSWLFLLPPLPMASPFAVGIPAENEATLERYLTAFYTDDAVRPDIMIVTRDEFLPPQSSLQMQLLERYYRPMTDIDARTTLWVRRDLHRATGSERCPDPGAGSPPAVSARAVRSRAY